MADDRDTLDSVQEHLKLALERYRTETRVRGDFMERVFGVHHGLSRAFDILLRDSDFLRGNQEPSRSATPTATGGTKATSAPTSRPTSTATRTT